MSVNTVGGSNVMTVSLPSVPGVTVSLPTLSPVSVTNHATNHVSNNVNKVVSNSVNNVVNISTSVTNVNTIQPGQSLLTSNRVQPG